jgi:hypothetical protein
MRKLEDLNSSGEAEHGNVSGELAVGVILRRKTIKDVRLHLSER